jgi:hypothetical protein
MANNKNPNEKQPGENPEGKYHFNPGNMAGKGPEMRSRLLKTAANRMSLCPRKSPPIKRRVCCRGSYDVVQMWRSCALPAIALSRG